VQVFDFYYIKHWELEEKPFWKALDQHEGLPPFSLPYSFLYGESYIGATHPSGE
jgi:hypothetical protein